MHVCLIGLLILQCFVNDSQLLLVIYLQWFKTYAKSFQCGKKQKKLLLQDKEEMGTMVLRIFVSIGTES